MGGKVLVQQGWEPHALELSQQQRQVIDAFDVNRFEDVVNHAQSRFPQHKKWSKNGVRNASYDRWCGLVLEKRRIPAAGPGGRSARSRRVPMGNSRAKGDRGPSQNTVSTYWSLRRSTERLTGAPSIDPSPPIRKPRSF
jgi:hypothetical protein